MATVRYCHGAAEVIGGQWRIVMPDRTGTGAVYNRVPESVHIEHMHRLRGVRKCVFRTAILARDCRASVQSTCTRLLSLSNSTISLFSVTKVYGVLSGYTGQL